MPENPQLSVNVLRHGTPEPPPQGRLLRAGPLTAVYHHGDLRYICLGGTEILRRVYVAVRDESWGTIPNRLSNVRIHAEEDSFHITFTAENVRGPIDFTWQGSLTGERNGTITCMMAGRARSTFLRNRIGLCVLHPPTLAGETCRVEDPGGKVSERRFPTLISPRRPLENVRALSYAAPNDPSVTVHIRCEGDIFETEDQRNWSDASFKTYSTPHHLPTPVKVAEGTTLSQMARLQLDGPVPRRAAPLRESEPVLLRLDTGRTSPLPPLGVAASAEELSGQQASRLAALGLDHLRVEVTPAAPGWRDALGRAQRQAHRAQTALHVAANISDDAEPEVMALLGELAELDVPLKAVILQGRGGDRWAGELRRRLDRTVLIGAGTWGDFVGLNMNPPEQTADLDVICFAVNPQVHTEDEWSIIEAAATQETMVRSARELAAQQAEAGVGPVTLRPREGKLATRPGEDELPETVDPRQMSLFAAGWTLKSLKYLARGGAAYATYYEVLGWRGIMASSEGSPLPEQFRCVPGMVYPIYHLLADVGELSRPRVVRAESSQPLAVEALALQTENRLRVIVANCSDRPRDVRIRPLPARVTLRRLDETNAEQALLVPEGFRRRTAETLPLRDQTAAVALPPCGLACLDAVLP